MPLKAHHCFVRDQEQFFDFWSNFDFFWNVYVLNSSQFDNSIFFFEISNFFRGIRVKIKTPKAIASIVGPVGEFQIIEVCNPSTTETSPITDEIIAICIGVDDKFLEAAAGIIRRPVINNIPTILIEIAITLAIRIVKIALARSAFKPSALANSKFTVAANRGLQISINTIKTMLPPIQTNKTSVMLLIKYHQKVDP